MSDLVLVAEAAMVFMQVVKDMWELNWLPESPFLLFGLDAERAISVFCPFLPIGDPVYTARRLSDGGL